MLISGGLSFNNERNPAKNAHGLRTPNLFWLGVMRRRLQFASVNPLGFNTSCVAHTEAAEAARSGILQIRVFPRVYSRVPAVSLA